MNKMANAVVDFDAYVDVCFSLSISHLYYTFVFACSCACVASENQAFEHKIPGPLVKEP